jgi:hypothetical protein
MNDIPPKHTPDATGGNLVAMYQASGSNAESFPVLKAFQEYIDAERAQARKRVMLLSISFSIVLCAVVLVFLGMGIYMLKDMSALQSKLVDAALSQRNVPAPVITVTAPPVVPQPAPVVQAQPVAPVASPVSEELREVSKALAELKADIEKKKNQEAQEVALVAQRKAADQTVELQKLQNEMGSIRKENQMLKETFVTQRKATQQQKSVPGTRPTATVAKSEPVKRHETEKPVEPEPDPAVAVSAEKTVVTPPPVTDEARYPVATKEPPVTPTGVKSQDPQKGMMATSIPLKTKNMGTVAWRVIIPE